MTDTTTGTEHGPTATVPAESTGELSALRFLGRYGNFRRLLLASLTSGAGDQLNRVAVLTLVFSISGSGVAVAVTLAVRIAARLLVAPLAAVTADRLPRRTVLIAADLARAVIALSFLAFDSRTALWVVAVAVASIEGISAFFGPARSALVPNLVDEQQLPRANGLDQSVDGLVVAIGSFVAGAAIAAAGQDFAFAANSASFLLSALLILRIRVPVVAAKPRSVGDRFRDVLPVVLKSPQLRLVGLLFCLWPLAGGTLSVLIPAYAFESFHAGSWGVGVLYGSLGLGYLIGGLLTGRLGKQVNGNGRVVAVLTVACEGLLYLLASQAGSLWPAALMMLIGTVAGGVGNAASDTLVMVHAPSEVLGRVYGLLMTVSSVSLVTAMLLSGLALNVMAPSTLGLCSGAVLVLASAVAWVIGRPRSAGSVE